jgi:hypothetical protein
VGSIPLESFLTTGTSSIDSYREVRLSYKHVTIKNEWIESTHSGKSPAVESYLLEGQAVLTRGVKSLVRVSLTYR